MDIGLVAARDPIQHAPQQQVIDGAIAMQRLVRPQGNLALRDMARDTACCSKTSTASAWTAPAGSRRMPNTLAARSGRPLAESNLAGVVKRRANCGTWAAARRESLVRDGREVRHCNAAAYSMPCMAKEHDHERFHPHTNPAAFSPRLDGRSHGVQRTQSLQRSWPVRLGAQAHSSPGGGAVLSRRSTSRHGQRLAHRQRRHRARRW